MFDAIAPRYDLVNRVMTFRMDVGWRRRTVRDAAARTRARWWPTWPAAPATSAASCNGQDLRPVGFDLSFGMLAAARTGAPLAQSDILRLPVPDAAPSTG